MESHERAGVEILRVLFRLSPLSLSIVSYKSVPCACIGKQTVGAVYRTMHFFALEDTGTDEDDAMLRKKLSPSSQCACTGSIHVCVCIT